jgi:hypothetical protein
MPPSERGVLLSVRLDDQNIGLPLLPRHSEISSPQTLEQRPDSLEEPGSLQKRIPPADGNAVMRIKRADVMNVVVLP